MENKTANKRYELSMEELELVNGSGFFDVLKRLADETVDTIKNIFD